MGFFGVCVVVLFFVVFLFLLDLVGVFYWVFLLLLGFLLGFFIVVGFFYWFFYCCWGFCCCFCCLHRFRILKRAVGWRLHILTTVPSSPTLTSHKT